jgi:acetyl esterase/lipase
MALDPPPSTQRVDIGRAFHHLASMSAEVASEDPIASMRRFVDRYGDVEPRPSLERVSIQAIGAEGVRGEWVVPQERRGEGRILHLHGGGWVAGGLESHRPMSAALALRTGLPVLLLDYRLAPEHPFPAGFHDCSSALEHAFDQGPEGPGPTGRVFIVGDSAGANLAAAVCQRQLATGGRAPRRLALMSPPLDGACNPARGAAAEANGDQAALAAMMGVYLQDPGLLADPRVSPLNAPDEVLARFPPTLLQVSSGEFLLWDSKRFAERLQDNGARVVLSVWPGLPHVWQAFLSLLPEARMALDEVAAFLGQEGIGHADPP